MKILNYSDFISSKENKSESTEIKSTENEEVNEGILDSILRFFKGLFELFDDKYVKKDAEESQKYFADIQNDEEISDENLADEIDAKKVRNFSDSMNTSIKKRIKKDEDDGTKSHKDIEKSFMSWLGMIVVYEESLQMPLFEKMTKNPELAKRFTWVPPKWSKGSKPMKDWYKQKQCTPDPKILEFFAQLSTMDPKEKKSKIEKFVPVFIEKEALYNPESLKSYKDDNQEELDRVYAGLSAMAIGVQEAMWSVIKNTQDEKLSEVIAKEIIKKRKTKAKTAPKKPEEKKSEKPEEKASDKKSKTSAKPEDK